MQKSVEGFRQYLESLNILPNNQLPYFLWWVKHYNQLGNPEEVRYSDILEEEGREAWQIRQALDAVKLYQQYTGKNEGEIEVGDLDPVEKLVRKLKIRHYARSTVRTYSMWSKDYLSFCRERNLALDDDKSFCSYMSHLALGRHVAASTQNQAFNALLFLFRNVWGKEPEGINAVRARKPRRLPVVLTPDEVADVLEKTQGVTGLILRIIYSSGLRLHEALSLRVKDIDHEGPSLMVRGGKGDKDRVTILSSKLVPIIRGHLKSQSDAFQCERIPVSLPGALERKYQKAGLDWKWQYVFPSDNPSISPDTGEIRRHHIHPSSVQRAMRLAVKSSGISKHATIHTLRHSFATHLLMSGVDICEIQELLGHKNLETTRVYLHVMKGMKATTKSPYDLLCGT